MMDETKPLAANLNHQLDIDFALQAAGLGTWDLDPITQLVHWDDRCRELFGLTKENQLPYQRAINYIHLDDVSRVEAAVQWAMDPQSGGMFDVTFRTIAADSRKLRWVRSMGKSYFTESGVVYRFAGVAQDVTKDMLAQDKTDLLEAVFDGTSAGISVLTSVRNEQGTITDFAYQLANRVTKQFTTPLELAGQLYSSLHPAYRQAGIFDDFVQVVETGQPIECDRHYTGEGLDNWYATVTVRYNDGVVFTFRDITAERTARQQIKASEQQLRSLVESAPFPIGVYAGREMRILLANQSILDIWEKGNDVIGKRFSDILPELENQQIFAQLDRVYTTGTPFHAHSQRVELVVDGKIRPYYFNYSFTPLVDAQGQVYGVMNTAADVTDLALAKQQIEESENRFRTLANSIDQLAWIANADGWIHWYNERWYEYTGTNLEQMQGWGWQLVHHPDHQDRVVSFIREAWGRDQPFELTFPLRDKAGNYRWFLTRVYPVKDEQGQIIQWVGTNTDIDEQKTMAERLEQLVAERTQQLEASIQGLERSNRNLEQFAYVASHDLQEPLRKIQSFGDMLKNQYADSLDEGVDYLNRMQSAASRMSTLINDLLSYSRISTRQDASVPVQLGEVVEMVLNNLEVAIGETSAQIIVESLPSIQGDASQLSQLFQNLLSNALKFRRDGVIPIIRVSCLRVKAADLPSSVRPVEIADLYYCIDVSDNGIGFDDKYADRIFGVFHRLHSRNQYPGTGIGLAICEKVAANHGGGITASSQPGQGARFMVYLPTMSD
ncbi:PAS domain-containing sensor histidine kinase [Spirosoma spitsbergense]|uniref:PAS domain-containing sensor histidine kinase n=1 Tax=Spirosoma spitsbergense TaxID=431554 RepID=UPI000382D1DC|nr:PAS domain-containing sensor histidine kinase [Spirosoma spitsbergense]